MIETTQIVVRDQYIRVPVLLSNGRNLPRMKRLSLPWPTTPEHLQIKNLLCLERHTAMEQRSTVTTKSLPGSFNTHGVHTVIFLWRPMGEKPFCGLSPHRRPTSQLSGQVAECYRLLTKPTCCTELPSCLGSSCGKDLRNHPSSPGRPSVISRQLDDATPP